MRSGRLTSQKNSIDMHGNQNQINPSVNFTQPQAQQPPHFVNHFGWHPENQLNNGNIVGANTASGQYFGGQQNHSMQIDEMTNNQSQLGGNQQMVRQQ